MSRWGCVGDRGGGSLVWGLRGGGIGGGCGGGGAGGGGCTV